MQLSNICAVRLPFKHIAYTLYTSTLDEDFINTSFSLTLYL